MPDAHRSTLSQAVRLAPALPTVLLVLLAALGQSTAHSAPAAPLSIQQTMATRIDPASDALWAAVGTEETARGTHQRAPRNAAQWQAVAGQAQVLVNAARHLQAGRIPVGADAHSRLADADTPGTRTAAQIRADIDAAPARFRAAAHRLERASTQALAAARRHDPQGLIVAGAAIDAACEACHAAYWYPRTPPLPLLPPDDFGAQALKP
jgi:cytochrome c556